KYREALLIQLGWRRWWKEVGQLFFVIRRLIRARNNSLVEGQRIAGRLIKFQPHVADGSTATGVRHQQYGFSRRAHQKHLDVRWERMSQPLQRDRHAVDQARPSPH